MEQRLDRIMAFDPAHAAGFKRGRMIRKARSNLFVVVRNTGLELTGNGPEGASRSCAVYREITNGFRQEWGAHPYADIGSVIEVARRCSIHAIDAIRLTLEGDRFSQRRQERAECTSVGRHRVTVEETAHHLGKPCTLDGDRWFLRRRSSSITALSLALASSTPLDFTALKPIGG